MSTAKRIVKNAGVLIIGEVLSRILSFILIIMIARQFGEVGLGQYSFIFAFVGLFSVFSDFGTSVLMTRELSKSTSKAKEFFAKSLGLKIIISIFATILPIVFILFTGQSSEIKIGVILASIAMLMYYLALPFRAIVNAYEAQIYQSIYGFSERLVAALLGIYVVWNGYGLLPLVLVFIASNGFSFFVICRLGSPSHSDSSGSEGCLCQSALQLLLPSPIQFFGLVGWICSSF